MPLTLPPLLRGLLALVMVAWVVATLTFLLMRSIPGGPLDAERQLPAAVRDAVAARYNLDQPVLVQYLHYLRDVARGEFGLSYNEPGRTVGEIIVQRAPVSALLGTVSILLSLLVAFPLGIFAAIRRESWLDRLNAGVATVGVAVPSFIIASLLLYVFAYQLRVFPSGGWRGPASIVLPALALAALPAAYLARLVRGELIEVLNSDFLMTARAKGLSESRVVLVHALRHTLGPVLAWLGPQAAAVMSGSFVVERIFNIPGLGQYFVNSINNRDYPVILGVTLCYTVLLVTFNLLAEAGARLVDPRLRSRA